MPLQKDSSTHTVGRIKGRECRVCHVTTVHPPFDNRIFFKMCTSLADAGYDVTLLCARAVSQLRNNVNIVGFPGHTQRLKRCLITSIFRAYREARKVDAGIYHLHDLELVWTGLLLRAHGKTVIMDVHENNAASVLTKPYLQSAVVKRVLSAVIRQVENSLFRRFSALVTARPDIAALYPTLASVTIRNFPVLPDLAAVQPVEIKKTRPAVIYVGGLSTIRGTLELVAAMEHLGDAELWILGPFESNSFRARCESLAGWKKVRYFGCVEASQVFSYIRMADAGVVTFLPYPNHITTLATKPFEYMACGLPMVMSDFPYWREFFGDAALYCNPADPRDIAKCIGALLADHELGGAMGRQNLKLAREQYNWEKEKERLLSLYAKLTMRSAGS